jgi:hypothetical protein
VPVGLANSAASCQHSQTPPHPASPHRPCQRQQAAKSRQLGQGKQDRKGKERKGKERKGKERKGKERKQGKGVFWTDKKRLQDRMERKRDA